MSADIEKWKQSSLFKKLLSDAPNIEKDLEGFNSKYRDFVTRDHVPIGIVLRCHLIIEHFLDLYLAATNPSIHSWDDARLSFAQKLTLAENPHGTLRILLPGLKCLNTLRNRLAHRLDTEFDDDAIAPIREFITVWYRAAGKVVPEGMQVIEAFALLASSWMYSDACMIKRHSPKEGLTGLLDWYKDP